MKATLFSRVPYMGPAPGGVWPVPTAAFSPEAAEQSMEASLEQFELADELGFDWITLAEHHYAPLSLTPNPMVMAGARVPAGAPREDRAARRQHPDAQPGAGRRGVRHAGRAHRRAARGRDAARHRDRVRDLRHESRPSRASGSRRRSSSSCRAWTEPQPFGWLGRYYEYRTISIWPRPIQQPHPPIFMSGSSPESGELAARHRLAPGAGVHDGAAGAQGGALLPRAGGGGRLGAHARALLYRLPVHVAETDEQAIEDLRASGAAAGPASYTGSNRAVGEAVASAGYYGRDAATQRGRLQARALEERIELGQLLVGGPETVLAQIQAIQGELGAGILDLNFLAVSPDKILRAIELFGTKVLPRMREL